MSDLRKHQNFKISVICVFNEKKLLEDFLLSSLKKQGYKNYELILVDSLNLGFDRASDALNYGYQKSNGDILLFIHQDVELLEESILSSIAEYSSKNEFGVAGVAGIVEKENQVYSSVLQGKEKKTAGNIISRSLDVDSIDECMFFVKRDSFKCFDDLGKTWHLYAVNYSIKCKLSNEKVVIVPLPIYHFSPGWSLNDSYWNTVIKLGERYRGQINMIPTVFGIYPNTFLLPLYLYIKKKYIMVNESLKRKFKKENKNG